MNILHVTPCYAPAWAYGPVPASVASLARAQRAAGHTVSVLTTDAMAPHERLEPGESVLDGVRVIRVPNISGSTRTWFGCSTPIGMRRRARNLFDTGRVDVVHLHELITIENLRVVPVVPATVPIVASLHAQLTRGSGPSARVARLWLSAGGKDVLSRIRRFVVGSADEEDALLRRRTSPLELAGSAVRLVPYGVDLTPFTSATTEASARTSNADDGPVLLIPGPPGDDPAARTLLESLTLLQQDYPSVRLVCAGADAGGRAALVDLARHASLESRVSFPGYVPVSVMPRLVAAAAVLTLPARHDERSMCMLGAMALGIPLVGTAETLPPEVQSAGVVLASTPPSAVDWATALREALGDRDGRARMGNEGRRLAASWEWPAVAATWDEVYAAAGACRA